VSAPELPKQNGLPSSDPVAPLDHHAVRAAAWLRAALSRAQGRAYQPSEELGAAVRIYVKHLRESGVTPERALVMVKAMLQEALDDLSLGAPQRALAQRVVTEAIDAYFAQR
jgi:hypothetical protein